MRENYSLSGKKLDPNREPTEYQKGIFFGLNRKHAGAATPMHGIQFKGEGRTKRKAMNRAAKTMRKNRGDR